MEQPCDHKIDARDRGEVTGDDCPGRTGPLVEFALRRRLEGNSPYTLERIGPKQPSWVAKDTQLFVLTSSGLTEMTSENEFASFSTYNDWDRESANYESLRSIPLFKNFYVRRGLIRYQNRVKASLFTRRRRAIANSYLALRDPFGEALRTINSELMRLVDSPSFHKQSESISWENMLILLDRNIDAFTTIVTTVCSNISQCTTDVSLAVTTRGSDSPIISGHDLYRLGVSERTRLEQEHSLKIKTRERNIQSLPKFIRLIGLKLHHVLEVVRRDATTALEDGFAFPPGVCLEFSAYLEVDGRLAWIRAQDIKDALGSRLQVINHILDVNMKAFHVKLNLATGTLVDRSLQLLDEVERIASPCITSLNLLPVERFKPQTRACEIIRDKCQCDDSPEATSRYLSTLVDAQRSLSSVPDQLITGMLSLELRTSKAKIALLLDPLIAEMKLQSIVAVRTQLQRIQSKLDALSKILADRVENVDNYVKARANLIQVESTTRPELLAEVADIQCIVENIASHGARFSNEDTYMLENQRSKMRKIDDDELPAFQAVVRKFKPRADEHFYTMVRDYMQSYAKFDEQLSNVLKIDPMEFPPIEHMDADVDHLSDTFENLTRLAIGIGDSETTFSNPALLKNKLKSTEEDFDLLRQMVDAVSNFRCMPVSRKRVMDFKSLIEQLIVAGNEVPVTPIRECLLTQASYWVGSKLNVLEAVTDEAWTVSGWNSLGARSGLVFPESVSDITVEVIEEAGVFAIGSLVEEILAKRERIIQFKTKWSQIILPMAGSLPDTDRINEIMAEMIQDLSDHGLKDVDSLMESVRNLDGLCRFVNIETAKDESSSIFQARAEFSASDLTVLTWFRACPTTTVLIQPYI